MHPRNPYRTPPDFTSLAEHYPPLKPFLITKSHKSTIDFKSDTAQRCLTSALLTQDFSLSISLPPDRLCPPVPNRLNYVLWIQDIIAESQTRTSNYVWGIDIGTGASAIYPLLACTLECTWMFVATDIDLQSLAYARSNVASNNLQDRVRVREAPSTSQLLFPLDERHNRNVSFSSESQNCFHFTMCNPPFYSSREEVEKSVQDKELAPNAVCTGADVEMITPGGENSFVCQMVRESLHHRNRCRWYTSMLGKMSTLFQVVGLLREHDIDNYAITEFIQGHTRRWAIGWSFGDERLPDTISRISNPALQSIMPPKNTLRQSIRLDNRTLSTKVKNILTSINGLTFVREVEKPGDAFDIHIHVSGDTWSRSARRKKTHQMDIDQERSAELSSAILECRLTSTEANLEFRWMKGRDRSLFESLVSHISRKILS